MAVKLTPAQASIRLARMAAGMQKEVRASEKRVLRYALDRARQMSSGPYSARQLAQMGHPYARRRPRPPADPAVLNVSQRRGTENLREQWRVRGPYNSGSGLRSYLMNLASYAGYVMAPGGTDRMIPRPIIKRLRAAVASFRYRETVSAIFSGLSGR